MSARIQFSPSEVSAYYRARLPKIRQSGPEWRGPCPNHRGKRDSFAVDPKTGHAFCHSQCGRGGDIIWLEMELEGTDFPAARDAVFRIVGRPAVNGTGRQIIAEYNYTDESGKLLFQCVRYAPKGFSQRRPRPDGIDGWIWNLKGVGLVPFCLPKIVAAETVYICEGEKDVRTLEKLGVVATCNPMGAGKWRPDYARYFHTKHVVIVTDNDFDGRKHAVAVAASVLSTAASVRVVELPGLPPKGDVTDWHNQGGTVQQLQELTTSAPPLDAAALSELRVRWGSAEAKPSADVQTDWPEPTPIGEHILRPIPASALPSPLGEHAMAVAAATETPTELAVMMDLAAVSTCTARKFEVSAEPGYNEPMNVWTIAALESGARKTAVTKESTEPLITWEKEKAAASRPKIEKTESLRKTMEERIKSLRKQAADPKKRMDDIQKEIEELEATLPRIPKEPKLWVDDITPEHLGTVMADNDERIAILSDEGGIFDLIGGRYNNGVSNLDLCLKAHSGSPVKVDRGSRPSIFMQRPALTLGLCPQPEVLQSLARKPEFRGRGLLARPLYALPKSNLGYRDLQPRPISAAVKAEYAEVLRKILDMPYHRGATDCGAADCAPHVIELEPDAYFEWKAFQRCIETEMRPGEKLSHVTDWASKLPGAALRVAGNFHVVKHASSESWKHLIDRAIMSAALELVTVLIPHALVAFDLIGEDPLRSDARVVLRWIRTKGKGSFTAHDCFKAFQGRFKRMDAFWPVLEFLVKSDYLRLMPKQKASHRPSVIYLVNPKVLEDRNR